MMCGGTLQGSIETWMLLEYADRGSLEQAIQARRFYKRTDATLDLVSSAARPAGLTMTSPKDRTRCKRPHAPAVVHTARGTALALVNTR